MSPILVAGLLATFLAGCAQDVEYDTTCPATNTFGVVQSVNGTDVQVRLRDGSPAVLHAADADLYQLAGENDCFEAPWSAMAPGKELDFRVDAWAESYPVQGWPDVVIIRG